MVFLFTINCSDSLIFCYLLETKGSGWRMVEKAQRRRKEEDFHSRLLLPLSCQSHNNSTTNVCFLFSPFFLFYLTLI